MHTTDGPQEAEPHIIGLRLGLPDPATLLTPELRVAMERLIRSPQAARALQYGEEQGAPDLITLLLKKITQEQRLALQPANLMIVAGATHAIDLLARLYAKPSGVVLVEAPTFADALSIFRDHHLETCPIGLDDEGLLPGELEQQVTQLHKRGKSPALLYTIPTFHNPTGRTTSEKRRLEVLRLARRFGFLIVEDDVYRDLAFEGPVPPSYLALAQGQQVCSIGSFSKTLAPGLRLGWLIGPEEIIERCVNCGTTQMGGGANPFAAHIVAEYCRSGAWEPHILHLRHVYQHRRNLALAALEQYMPADVRWTRPAGGFFLWLRLPGTVFARDVKRLALQQGVEVASGEGFFVRPAEGAHHLRLAYTRAAPDELETGIRILAQIIAHLQTASSEDADREEPLHSR